MATPVAEKTNRARLEMRVPAELKTLTETAAALMGLSVTDFAVLAMREKAEHVIEHLPVIRLSAEDSKIFADVVLNQTEPNEALKAAATRYREIFCNLP